MSEFDPNEPDLDEDFEPTEEQKLRWEHERDVIDGAYNFYRTYEMLQDADKGDELLASLVGAWETLGLDLNMAFLAGKHGRTDLPGDKAASEFRNVGKLLTAWCDEIHHKRIDAFPIVKAIQAREQKVRENAIGRKISDVTEDQKSAWYGAFADSCVTTERIKIHLECRGLIFSFRFMDKESRAEHIYQSNPDYWDFPNRKGNGTLEEFAKKIGKSKRAAKNTAAWKKIMSNREGLKRAAWIERDKTRV